MTNTLETVWKLVLDEQSADKADDAIVNLAESAGKLGEELNKIARQKSFEAMARDAGKLALETGKAEEAAADLYRRLQEIGATEDELKSVAKTFGDVSSGEQERGGGGNAPAAGKFRGAAGLIGGSGASELVGMVDDLQDAIEGFQQLRVALTGAQAAQAATTAATTAQTAATTAVGTASAVAAPGLLASAAGFAALLLPLLPFVAIAAAVAGAVVAINSAENARAEALKQEMEIVRSINDEIAAGATKEDIEAQIEALRFRSELEKVTLEESKQKYDDYINSIRNAFGGLGRILEPFIRLFGSYEEELSSQVNESQKLIDGNTQKEELYTAALEKGLTKKNDAAQAEEELADAREKSEKEAQQAADKAAREQEAAQKKAQADQERANAEAQREAEQFQQKQAQVEEKRYQAAQNYGDKLVDIAQKAADDAAKLATGLKQKLTDNQRATQNDLSDMAADFADSEHEEAIQRQEEEAADLRAHADKLKQIRDGALTEEADLLNQRNFLGATKVRERANAQIEAENKVFLDGQDEKLRLQKSEDAKQLRELDKARRERLTQLQRANTEAQLQYKRDVENQREARRIAEREAATARDRELRSANEMARALLGIHQQTANAQLQLAQSTLNSLRGMGNTTNNNQNNSSTWNGNMVFNSSQTLPPSQIANTMINMLGSVGLIGQQ